VRADDFSLKMSKWCRLHYNDGTLFNVPSLCEELGMNPDSRTDYQKIYGVIKSWRDGFISKYNKMKEAGALNDMTRYEAWDIMLHNYNKNDAYVFLSIYDKEGDCRYFIQPSFLDLEDMDKKRLERQWNGIMTVIKEMQILDARLVLPDGSRKPITELLEAGNDVNKLLKEGKDDEN